MIVIFDKQIEFLHDLALFKYIYLLYNIGSIRRDMHAYRYLGTYTQGRI